MRCNRLGAVDVSRAESPRRRMFPRRTDETGGIAMASRKRSKFTVVDTVEHAKFVQQRRRHTTTFESKHLAITGIQQSHLLRCSSASA